MLAVSIVACAHTHWSLAAIDWLSRDGPEGESPLKGKPYAVVSAGGGSGGMRAQKNIIALGDAFKMTHISAGSPVAVPLFDGQMRFDSVSGDLTDGEVKAAIAALVAALEKAAVTHKAS